MPLHYEKGSAKEIVKPVMSRGIRNPGVRQWLGFCTADCWSTLAYESAEQKLQDSWYVWSCHQPHWYKGEPNVNNTFRLIKACNGSWAARANRVDLVRPWVMWINESGKWLLTRKTQVKLELKNLVERTWDLSYFRYDAIGLSGLCWMSALVSALAYGFVLELVPDVREASLEAQIERTLLW